MTLKNNRAPLLCCFQLCAWFHCHMWIQTGVRVRKRLSWVLTSVTLTFDLWPWPFAWTSLLTMVITPENFMMIRWWEHGEKGVTVRQTDGRTDRRTDGRTDWTSHIAAWSQLKIAMDKEELWILEFNTALGTIFFTVIGLWAQHRQPISYAWISFIAEANLRLAITNLRLTITFPRCSCKTCGYIKALTNKNPLRQKAHWGRDKMAAISQATLWKCLNSD